MKANGTIEWTTASLNAATEMFNIMIVSQDYTDIMQGFSSNYARGIDNAVEEEIILDLVDLIPKYMPVYESMIQADPDLVRRTTTDSGVRGAVYCIYTVPQMPWSGLCIRQDWLEKLNLESPRTYDQLHDVLVAFRDQMGADAPLSLGMIGDSCWMGGWNVGFAYAGGFGGPNCMMQKDGVVTYGPLEPGYKEYLETFSQWYQEGLIDKDFAGNAMEYIISELVYKNETGVWWGIGQGDQAANPAATDPDYHAVGIQNFIQTETQGTSHFCVDSAPIGIGSAVSTTCKDIELALRWMDYCYGDGAVALNFGYEGEHFYFDEDGEPTMDAEKMMAYFGEDSYGTIRQATGPVEAAYLRYMDRGLPVKKSSIPNSEESVNVAWKYDDNDWAIPSNISMTVEESEEYNSIFTDIQTQVMEYTVKIIMGEYDMSKYDDLMKSLEAQNIQRAIEIMQAVVDRYYARGSN